MAEKGFELGVKVRLDVDDAQLNLVQARAGLARGRRDLLAAQVNLRWVTGELSPAPSASPSPDERRGGAREVSTRTSEYDGGPQRQDPQLHGRLS